jgi:hypothetical protein
MNMKDFVFNSIYKGALAGGRASERQRIMLLWG